MTEGSTLTPSTAPSATPVTLSPGLLTPVSTKAPSLVNPDLDDVSNERAGVEGIQIFMFTATVVISLSLIILVLRLRTFSRRLEELESPKMPFPTLVISERTVPAPCPSL